MDCKDLQKFISGLHPKFEYFHLFSCGACSAPTFQYPCPTCKYWNDWTYEHIMEKQAKEHRASVVDPKEKWISQVKKEGNIFRWYLRHGIMNSLLFKPNTYTRLTEKDYRLKCEIQNLYDGGLKYSFPEPEEIWDMVIENK